MVSVSLVIIVCAYAHSTPLDQQIRAMRTSLIAICDRIDKIDVQLQSLHPTPSIEDKIPQLDGIVQDVNNDDDLFFIFY